MISGKYFNSLDQNRCCRLSTSRRSVCGKGEQGNQILTTKLKEQRSARRKDKKKLAKARSKYCRGTEGLLSLRTPQHLLEGGEGRSVGYDLQGLSTRPAAAYNCVSGISAGGSNGCPWEASDVFSSVLKCSIHAQRLCFLPSSEFFDNPRSKGLFVRSGIRAHSPCQAHRADLELDNLQPYLRAQAPS